MSRFRALAIAALLSALVSNAHADNTRGARAGDVNVDWLIAQMTLDEKLTLIEGDDEPASPDRQFQAGYIPGIPRLGIPSLKLSDGPPGVATRQPSTGMVSTMGLAATFSIADAQRNGVVIGRDARALGQDVVLEPFVNLDRDTAWGRGFNTFGEDPLLSGTIGAAEISGIQSQGVMAQVKHFVAFEGGNNVVVDDQTLHEVYLQPFALAVDAGVASIMCSYNVVNGVHACGNSTLLTQILRNELGFEGFVTSDWGANHASTYLNAGLDLEMPGGAPAAGLDMPSFFARPSLHEAIAAGSVKITRVDEAVARLLRQYKRFGLLSGGGKHSITAQDRATNATIGLETARRAATLLKNTPGSLPLSAAALGSLALIGPGAAQTIATNGGGEKPGGIVARQIGTYQALGQRLKDDSSVRLHLALADDHAGTAIPASALTHGLSRLDRASGETAIDAQLAFTSSANSALPAGTNRTWSGSLIAPEAGDYWLNIQALGATARLVVDGVTLATVGAGLTAAPRYGAVHPCDGSAPMPTPDGLANSRSRLRLSQGAHKLEVIETADDSHAPVQVRLAWVTPQQRRSDRAAAVAEARKAHSAVVFAWSGGDLSAPLPEEQDQLIRAVAQVNPNTIVVLNTSQPVAMPWLSQVKAVLQMWYPGDEGGWATADVLLGRTNPGGHLPFTWPRAIEQLAAHQSDHPERSSKGVGGTGKCVAFGGVTGYNCGLTRYSEGVNVGYRYFDASRQTPLFAFGHGLSYSHFSYSDLRLERQPDGLKVTFQIHNDSTRAGDAVPQIYLGAPSDRPRGTQFAARALAAYDRVRMEPGQTLTTSIHVPLRELQYWSLTQGWTTATGTRSVSVAENARDSRLSAELEINR